MARARRSVGYEDRLSIVEHLTELRGRLVKIILIFTATFAVCWYFNDGVIGLVNDPLTQSQTPRCEVQQADPLAQTTCFQRSVGQALGALGPALRGLSDDVDELGAGASAAQRREVRERTKRLEDAARATDAAARAAPTSTARNPVTLGVAEPFFQTFTVSAYAALVISLPLLLWQLYAFLIPAFSPKEKRVALPLLWAVPLLFYSGVAFAYFAALPRAVDFLQNFNDDNFDILVQAKEYYRFTAVFLGGIGVLFQVPVVVLGISRLGILSARQMRKRRGPVLVGVAILAAIVTPTPDPVTMLIAMAPLVLLFEGSVALAAYFERRFPVDARFDLDTWGDAASEAGRSVGSAWGEVVADDEDDDPFRWDEDEDDDDEDDDRREPTASAASSARPASTVREDAPPVLPPGVAEPDPETDER